MSHQLYRHFDVGGRLLYVGVSASAVMLRLSAHRNTSVWFESIAIVTIQHFETRGEALKAERKALESECPEFNRRGLKNPAERAYRLRYIAKETWQTIGDLLGITRQRAQQLAAREARRSEKSAA